MVGHVTNTLELGNALKQGALDAFTETARDAKRMARPGVFEKVAESPLIQSLIGQAAARIDAAQTLMLTSLREGQDIVRAGGTLSIEQRVRIRRNHGFAARTSAESSPCPSRIRTASPGATCEARVTR